MKTKTLEEIKAIDSLALTAIIVGGPLLGFSLLAISEALMVFIDIEHNTRKG